jgi:hypothetical protein
MIAPIAAELPQTPQSSSEPQARRPRSLTAIRREPDMAFIDDATHTGRPLYDASSPVIRLPRQILTLAALATSVAIWAIIILIVANHF